MGRPGRGKTRPAGATARVVALLGSPVALFGVLLLDPSLDRYFLSPNFHVAVMSTIAACALFTAAVAWISAERTRSEAVVFVAFGCLGLAVFMLAHGLTTPGTLGQPINAWVARFPVLGIMTFAVFLAFAAFGSGTRIGAFVLR